MYRATLYVFLFVAFQLPTYGQYSGFSESGMREQSANERKRDREDERKHQREMDALYDDMFKEPSRSTKRSGRTRPSEGSPTSSSNGSRKPQTGSAFDTQSYNPGRSLHTKSKAELERERQKKAERRRQRYIEEMLSLPDVVRANSNQVNDKNRELYLDDARRLKAMQEANNGTSSTPPSPNDKTSLNFGEMHINNPGTNKSAYDDFVDQQQKNLKDFGKSLVGSAGMQERQPNSKLKFKWPKLNPVEAAAAAIKLAADGTLDRTRYEERIDIIKQADEYGNLAVHSVFYPHWNYKPTSDNAEKKIRLQEAVDRLSNSGRDSMMYAKHFSKPEGGNYYVWKTPDGNWLYSPNAPNPNTPHHGMYLPKDNAYGIRPGYLGSGVAPQFSEYSMGTSKKKGDLPNYVTSPPANPQSSPAPSRRPLINRLRDRRR